MLHGCDYGYCCSCYETDDMMMAKREATCTRSTNDEQSNTVAFHLELI